MIIEYAGKRLLIDPLLASKGAYPGFPGTPGSDKLNPLVDLPLAVESLVKVDAVIATHTHYDHWDKAANDLLPKGIRLLAQNADDADFFRSAGFSDVTPLEKEYVWEGITFNKTPARHGSEAALADPVMGKRLGQACGVILRHPSEKTVYFAGDTIWHPLVASTLEQFHPNVIVLNAGWAHINGVGAIIMGCEDVLNVHRSSPHAAMVAVHMEALNHCLLTRSELRSFAVQQGFTDKLSIPLDGEVIYL